MGEGGGGGGGNFAKEKKHRKRMAMGRGVWDSKMADHQHMSDGEKLKNWKNGIAGERREYGPHTRMVNRNGDGGVGRSAKQQQHCTMGSRRVPTIKSLDT